jgi:hypothetical protein
MALPANSGDFQVFFTEVAAQEHKSATNAQAAKKLR